MDGIEALASAGRALERGAFTEAEALCLEVLSRDPNDPHALTLLGNIYARAGNTYEAERTLELAVRFDPRNVIALNALGGIYGANGKPSLALESLRSALALDPHYPWARHNMAALLLTLEDIEGARRQYAELLDVFPNDAEALVGLGGIEEREGRTAEARALADRALSIVRNLPSALLLSAQIDLRGDDPASALPKLIAISNNRAANVMLRAQALSLQGRALEQMKRYDEAFHAFALANSSTRSTSAPRIARSRDVTSPGVIAQIARFGLSIDMSGWRNVVCEGSDPVFLLGFPRSGTTLLDQVLASHPDIECLEETETLRDAFASLILEDNAFERWAALSVTEINGFRRTYWERVQSALGHMPRGRVFIDKMPLNTVLLPMIYRLFPNAKIIFALRDPRDVVISCFKQRFLMNSAMFQFLSLDTAVAYYNAVMVVGEVARQRCELRIHNLKYEDLIGDFDRTTRALLTFLELPWKDDVRQFNETAKGRRIKTPSAAQVVKPLYGSSVGVWRNYRSHLEAHLPMLQHWIAAFGYAKS